MFCSDLLPLLCPLSDDIFRLAGWSSPAPGALGGNMVGGGNSGMNANAAGGIDGVSTASSPSPFSWRKGPILDQPAAVKDTGETPFSAPI